MSIINKIEIIRKNDRLVLTIVGSDIVKIILTKNIAVTHVFIHDNLLQKFSLCITTNVCFELDKNCKKNCSIRLY